MDFITGFPRSQKGNDSILVVIDRFSKVAHFLPVKETITASQLAELYVSRIVTSWCSVGDQLRSWKPLHFPFLEQFPGSHGNSSVF